MFLHIPSFDLSTPLRLHILEPLIYTPTRHLQTQPKLLLRTSADLADLEAAFPAHQPDVGLVFLVVRVHVHEHVHQVRRPLPDALLQPPVAGPRCGPVVLLPVHYELVLEAHAVPVAEVATVRLVRLLVALGRSGMSTG